MLKNGDDMKPAMLTITAQFEVSRRRKTVVEMVDYAYRGYSIDVEARHNVAFIYVGKKSQTTETCGYDKGINVAEAVEKL